MATLRIDDFTMHLVEAGEGTPVLLLHGLGGSLQEWQDQIAHLAPRYRVVAPDLRGFGQSACGRRVFSIPRFARDVRELLAQLKIDRCIIIGHSMGGAIAQQLALEQPQRVIKLVVTNSMPSFRPQTLKHYAEFVYRWLAMGLLGPERIARIGAWRMYPGDEQKALREISIARGADNSRYSYLAALAALGRWSLLSRLSQLTMPVLVIGSEFDYFTREEFVRFAHALPHGRLHIVDGAHHGLPMECPQRFNELLDDFLGGTALPAAAAS